MNPRTRVKWRQLLQIMVIWSLIGLLIALYDHLVLQTSGSAGLSAEYSLRRSIIVNIAAGLMGALLGGSLLVFFVNERFRDKSYGYTIATVTVSFVAVILIIGQALRLLEHPDMARMAKNGLIWALVVAITQMFLQINAKFGAGVFRDILRGKYNTPREEKRIFMFLDINASTTIAETLGDKRYHAFLKDFFTDITNPILENRGEIYQYVGDEVIIAWRYREGFAEANCVQCFFDIKNRIRSLQEKYLERYGVFPEFKAGIHCGPVVAGEVGIIKRDITYSGDVLNTTSRIQGMCKQFNEEVIASADLVSELHLSGTFATMTLGSIKLRGKEKEMALIALKPLRVA
ncbi:adenylate/guanylate cyclase domain-containing protein [Chitinophaga rhizosphaerae]|uniref:adenylate/guanylate cyclase domain-containing protein n=1 Tax=Chitinophaga rhizosphaerae TaxID=1864947 RepID=UPI000F805FB2|nr:adenylate/guanylate cyclase domain-containing protein [Chitinophaga rhizosphaerae]